MSSVSFRIRSSRDMAGVSRMPFRANVVNTALTVSSSGYYLHARRARTHSILAALFSKLLLVDAGLMPAIDCAHFVDPATAMSVLSVRLNLVGLIAIALAAYAFDCLGMATPEQAMQCCRSMPCSSHHHNHRHRSQDCCKTMPSAHAALGKASSVQGISFFPMVLGVLREPNEYDSAECPLRLIVKHCHAPPMDRFTSPILPLRI